MNKVRFAGSLFAVIGAFFFSQAGCGGGDDSSEPAADDYTQVPAWIHQNNPTCNYADGERYISFSGYCWKVRNTENPEAAGANYYSSDPRDVWVDDTGNLHMKISNRDGKWLCSEIEAIGTFGYGTYVFYVLGYPTRYDPNVVFGMFTWDNNFPEVRHISEIDIEITKWGKLAGNNLHYTVQPSHGPDDPDGWYRERGESVAMALNKPRTTHVFTWTADRVDFASYEGYGVPTDTPIGSWTFASSNPARRMNDSNLNVPVVIPTPTASSRVHMSFWLTDVAGDDGLGDPPVSSNEFEVVVEGFEFRPL